MIMKGRLDNLHTMLEQVRNPIILTKDHKVTQMLILWYHQINAHSGPEVTLRNIRMKYWSPGGKQQVRKAIRKCGHNLCRYPNTEAASQQIANLPIPRITPGNFEAVSLDFAGHLTSKNVAYAKTEKYATTA